MRVSFWIAVLWATASLSTRAAESPVVTHRRLDAPVEMHLVRFDRARVSLRVLDLARGQTVAQAAQAHGALAGVNGGYFKPDQTPLGLVMSRGVVLHPMEKSKILTGVLSVTARGATLLREAEFQPTRRVREALQSGPFLVDHGAAVPGLNAKRRAERTVLLADRQGVAADGFSRPEWKPVRNSVAVTPRP